MERLFGEVCDTFDRTDILVNNAERGGGSPLTEMPFDRWERAIRTNPDLMQEEMMGRRSRQT